MKAALKKGVEDGKLVQVKSSYKVSPDAKKTATAKPKKAAAAAKAKKPAAEKKKKTTATKKKVRQLKEGIIAASDLHLTRHSYGKRDVQTTTTTKKVSSPP
jgi:hypothetical protein